MTARQRVGFVMVVLGLVVLVWTGTMTLSIGTGVETAYGGKVRDEYGAANAVFLALDAGPEFAGR